MLNYIEYTMKNVNYNKRKPLTEAVYIGLRKTIINGMIPNGERIIEEEFAAKLRVSRTPLRTALKMLELEELIEYVPRKGLVVKGVSCEDVIEVYRIRQTLEVLVAKAAMKNITQDEIKQLEVLIELAEKKNEAEEIEEVLRLFAEFHSKIYEASRMKRLIEMISSLNDYIQRFLNIIFSKEERRQKALREHKEILKAIAEMDEEGIEIIVKKHIDSSFDAVFEELNK